MNHSHCWRTARRAGLVALLLVALHAPALAGKLAPDLDRKVKANPTPCEQQTVIVQFNQPGVDADLLAKTLGGKKLAKLGLINGATLSLPQKVIQSLANNPAVSLIAPDRQVLAQWDCDTQTVGASQIWSSPGLKGTGVRVAVLDTGVVAGNSEWLRAGQYNGVSRLVAFKDFVQNQTSPYDDNGHGTHVAGIVMGSGNKCASQNLLGQELK